MRDIPLLGGGRKKKVRGGGAEPGSVTDTIEDVDFLMQEFNHTGNVRIPNVDNFVQNVLTPTISNLVHTHFSKEIQVHGLQRGLADVIRQKGGTLPSSVQDARLQLRHFAKMCEEVCANWVRGEYHTIYSALNHGSLLMHHEPEKLRLLGCVSLLLDQFTSLQPEDARLISVVVFTLALATPIISVHRNYHRWESSTSPALNAEIQQTIQRLQREYKTVMQARQGTLKGGSKLTSANAALLPIHLLIFNRSLQQKQDSMDALQQLVDAHDPPGTVVGEEGEASRAASLSASMLGVLPVGGRNLSSATIQTLQQKTSSMYWGGGTPKSDMVKRVSIGKDSSYPSLQIYLFLHQPSNTMRMDYMLEELDELPNREGSPELKERVKFLNEEGANLGNLVRNPADNDTIRKKASAMAKRTDTMFANLVFEFIMNA